MNTHLVRMWATEPSILMGCGRAPIGMPPPTRDVERWISVETPSQRDIARRVKEDLRMVETSDLSRTMNEPSEADIAAAEACIAESRAHGHTRETIARAIAKARSDERERWQTMLAFDTPWPVAGVLGRLSSAATHLLKDHDCDAHGHETIGAARDAADEILRRMGIK